MNDKILFIMEGEKEDPKLLKSLLAAYRNVLDFDENAVNKEVIVSYTSNIYSLYNELKNLENDDFNELKKTEDNVEFSADLFSIVKKKTHLLWN